MYADFTKCQFIMWCIRGASAVSPDNVDTTCRCISNDALSNLKDPVCQNFWSINQNSNMCLSCHLSDASSSSNILIFQVQYTWRMQQSAIGFNHHHTVWSGLLLAMTIYAFLVLKCRAIMQQILGCHLSSATCPFISCTCFQLFIRTISQSVVISVESEGLHLFLSVQLGLEA